MRIAIDARMYGLEHAGIGRYVANLICEIKNQKSKIKNIKITLLVRKKNLEEIKQKFGDIFEIVVCDVSHYSVKEQIIVPLQLIKLKPDLTHFPHFNVPIFWWGRQVVTIHDLTKHESRGPETTTRQPLFYWFKYLNYLFLVCLAIKRAKKIIVPSQWWKKELMRRYNLPLGKVVVTYEGVDVDFKLSTISKEQSTKILKKYNIQRPFIIYTGSLYPHKNVERLIKAVVCYHVLKHSNKRLSLIVVCGRNVFYERLEKQIKRMKAEKFVNLVGFVPDKELAALYQQSEAFVFPTLLEGFGLPGLEAMATGCPVLASNIPVLREVYGRAVLYFNPRNVENITEKIKQIISDEKLEVKLKKLGLKQVRRYSWQKMAKETIKIYESCFSLRPG